MSSLLTNLLAMIFAVMLFELPVSLSEAYRESKNSELTSEPLFRVDPITHPSQKSSSKLNPIAQNFMPVVVLAPSLYEVRDFTYYIPLHSFHRPKDFFLLI